MEWFSDSHRKVWRKQAVLYVNDRPASEGGIN